MSSPGKGTTDTFTFYKSELKHEEQNVRLYATGKAVLIAYAIGPQRTVDELLPLLYESSKQDLFLNDDEFLFRLAEQYMTLTEYTAGNLGCFVAQVEWLAYQEETVIRDKAVECLACICDKSHKAGNQAICDEIVNVLHRLASAEWFTARLSSAALFPSVYKACSNDQQKAELRKIYANLAGDETPMVRRAAALKLKDFCAVIDKSNIGAEIMPVYRQLAQDDTQDIIRVACVHTSLVLIENHFRADPEENKSHTLLVLTSATEDRSWRVRLTLAQNFNRVVAALGQEITGGFLLNPFVSLLKDSEQEVRSAATGVIAKLCKEQSFSSEQLQNFLVPQFSSLSMDPSQMVRTSLASVIFLVAQSLGKDLTQRLMLGIITDMMKDEYHEVRLQAVNHAAEICGVLGLEVIAHSLLSTIQSLVMDNQWRIRKSVLEQIPALASQFGPEMFSSKLESIFFNSLGDSVHAVRFSAVQTAYDICHNFGIEWTLRSFLPRMLEQYQTNSGFSTRITILHALPQLSKVIKPDSVQSLLLPILLKGFQDIVPNVRLCACKLAPAICKGLPSGSINSSIKPVIEPLADSDGDPDVVAEAATAMKELGLR